MIKIEIYPPRQGGQQCGPGSSGIRGVHYLHDGEREYPTGIEAICNTERSQHKNKQVVAEMIEWACQATRVPFDLPTPTDH